ncbi:MAG: tripartite tricarboxylate transporter substrate binding protein [Reyranellaceae bacterium]
MLLRRSLLGAALAAPFVTRAQAWPNKPIRVILPGPVGGLIDIAGRAIGDVMQRQLGQPWLIDPRPGANGIVAAQMFLGAPADGYTLYFTVSGHVALPYLMKAPFDVMADFKPIAMVGVSTALLCVPPASPANTVAEFVAYAKANPGKLNYLNSGNGTGAHLLPELLKIKFGIDVTSISYKGLPPGVQDLLAGRLDLAMVSTTLVMQHVKAGRLKAIGLVGPKRLAELPDVATMAEQGAGDTEIRSMLPIYGQAGLDESIVGKVNAAVRAAQADADCRNRLAAAYIEPMPLDPAQTGEALAAEHARLGKLIQLLGIKADGAT